MYKVNFADGGGAEGICYAKLPGRTCTLDWRCCYLTVSPCGCLSL